VAEETRYTLKGRTIIDVRLMTEIEMTHEFGEPLVCPPTVLALDNGWMVFAAQDAELNGPGVLMGSDEGTGFWVFTDNRFAEMEKAASEEASAP
jgi:hypothetical protein